MHRYSAPLPELADTHDTAHAAATRAPSEDSTEESDIEEGSPTSMVHVGAPPPPPPPIPKIGGLTPPQQLIDASMSPILRNTTHENEI